MAHQTRTLESDDVTIKVMIATRYPRILMKLSPPVRRWVQITIATIVVCMQKFIQIAVWDIMPIIKSQYLCEASVLLCWDSCMVPDGTLHVGHVILVVCISLLAYPLHVSSLLASSSLDVMVIFFSRHVFALLLYCRSPLLQLLVVSSLRLSSHHSLKEDDYGTRERFWRSQSNVASRSLHSMSCTQTHN